MTDMPRLRAIALRHIWQKNTDRDDQGRLYGWTDAELDALITELLISNREAS